MRNPVCLGDATSHGGVVITATSSLDLEGRPAALLHDRVSCPVHGENRIIEAGDDLFDGDRPIVVDRCKTECGSYVIASESGVVIE